MAQAKEPLAESNLVVPASRPTPLGTLGRLPLELRCMVYSSVFAAASTALTRTSQALYIETQDSLSEHAMYRVTVKENQDRGNLDCVISGRVGDPQLLVLPTSVRNLDFHIPWLRLRMSRRVVVEKLAAIFNSIILQLRKPKHCRLTFKEFYDQTPVEVASLAVLQRFDAVSVTLEAGITLSRDSALERQGMSSCGKNFIPRIKEALGAKTRHPASTVLHTVRYVRADKWVVILKDREEDERGEYQMSNVKAGLHYIRGIPESRPRTYE